MKHLHLVIAIFVTLHCAILFAGFIAPYGPAEQNRDFTFAPPTRIHWFDSAGHFHLRPFIYALTPNADGDSYSEEKAARYPIHFVVHTRRPNSQKSELRLFGVDAPGRIFMLGTDAYGRDLFSRVLYGGRVSVAAALLATFLALMIGASLGAAAGLSGGLLDSGIMRLSELGMALSWFYLLLAVRAFLPLRIAPLETFFLISGVIGVTGWARPARLIRGLALSAKERGFVMSARGFGASGFYIFRRHILPQLKPLIFTQAAILIPQFMMAEVTLSFLGLGASEPVASWGNLLADLQQYRILVAYWWMAAPIVAIVLISSTYFFIANIFERRVQSVAI
jgi:ABC-type dipeptide/oligopeptide/nickel transport systems, permease components